MEKKKKIILISSDGGHLAQMLELEPLFLQYDYLLVTEKTETTLTLAEKYKVQFLKSRSQGKERSWLFYFTVLYNMVLSVRIILSHFPKAIITTGSHAAVPLCIVGKIFFIKIVYILSFARISSKAKSADVVYPIADRFIVQWEPVQKLYPKSIYLGGIY